MNGDDFLKLHKEGMDITGFWDETYKSSFIRAYEKLHHADIIKEWTIVDFTLNGHKVLVKWYKRHRPLTNEELQEKYGIYL
jgi:hypothetical protein